MRLGTADISDRVVVVAEIGNNHEGDVGRAREMVSAAAATGVDAVKFQTFRTRLFVRPQDEARWAQMKRFELSPEEFGELADLARSEGVGFVSTPLDLESAEFLEPLVDAFKIASGDLDFVPLVRRVAKSSKPLMLSTGVSGPERIRAAVALVEQVRGRPAAELAILHCVSAYPAPASDLNLGAIGWLRDEYGYPAGWSDHTLGNVAAVAAVALGARIVEKHFTLAGIESDFRDHALSAQPDEMAALVAAIREAEQMTGAPVKAIAPSEQRNVDAIRRSVSAARELPAGHVLAADDLVCLRPAGGVAPGDEESLIGHALARRVPAGETLHAEDVQ